MDWHFIKLYLKGNICLYPIWQAYKSLGKKHVTLSERVVTPYHDLVLDGWQRSANSYAFNLVKTFYPLLKVVHHTHSIATLKLARLFRVPTVVLIREPQDAIASCVIRRGEKNCDFLVREYVWYHLYVRRHLDDFQKVIGFELIIHNEIRFLSEITQILNLENKMISEEKIERVKRKIFNDLKKISKSRSPREYEKRMSIPSEKKVKLKAGVQREIVNSKFFPQAVRVYEELSQSVLSD